MWDNIGVHLFLIVLTVAFLFVLVIIFGRFLTFYQLPSEFLYENRPSLALLYVKGLAAALFRRQGDFAVRSPKESTDVDILINKALGRLSKSNQNGHVSQMSKIVCLDCRIDSDRLAKYAKACGYSPDIPLNFVPPCYLETYFLPLMICVTVTDDFKLSPLGLIHIGQTVTQHTNINHLLKEPFDAECSVAGYRFTTRGIEVDMAMKVYDRREMCVWQGVATLLSREKSVQKGGGKKPVPSKQEENITRKPQSLLVNVPADMGLQYARASGDWNPHHLWPWSAKLLGFKKPIAHGMWTLSRCLTWIKKTDKSSLDVPFHIDVQFKRPLFMPGASTFTLLPSIEKDKQKFAVHDKLSEEPQLVGSISRDT